MDQGASAKERLPRRHSHLPLRVGIVVVRAHVVAAGLGKPFTSLRHGRGRSQKNNVSGAGGARNKRSSLARSGGGADSWAAEKRALARQAGSQAGRRPIGTRFAIRARRRRTRTTTPPRAARTGEMMRFPAPRSARATAPDGGRPKEVADDTVGVSSARGRAAVCHGNPGAISDAERYLTNPNPNPNPNPAVGRRQE